jgi:hypothetical protein
MSLRWGSLNGGRCARPDSQTSWQFCFGATGAVQLVLSNAGTGQIGPTEISAGQVCTT